MSTVSVKLTERLKDSSLDIFKFLDKKEREKWNYPHHEGFSGLRTRGFLIRVQQHHRCGVVGHELVRPLAVGLHHTPRTACGDRGLIAAIHTQAIAQRPPPVLDVVAADAGTSRSVLIIIVFFRMGSQRIHTNRFLHRDNTLGKSAVRPLRGSCPWRCV